MQKVLRSKNKPSYVIPCVCLFCFFFSLPVFAVAPRIHQPLKLIRGWQYRLGKSPLNNQGIPTWVIKRDANDDGWINIPDIGKPAPIPKGTTTVWYRIKLPRGSWVSPCVYFEQINAQSLMIYLNNQKVYEKIRNWARYDNKTIIPLGQNYHDETLTLQMISNKNTFGPNQQVILGNHHELILKYFQNGFIDIILGFGLAFLAVIMMSCSFFLHQTIKKSWISLCLVTLMLGIAEAIYPNNLSPYFPSLDKYWTPLIDMITFLLFPILTYFFEQLFGPGYKLFIRRLWQIQAIYSLLCIGLMVLNFSPHPLIHSIYALFSNDITGFICIIQFFALIGTALYFSMKGDIDAKIFTTGFFVFAIISCYDIVKYFMFTPDNRFSSWKWGLLIFIISLIFILARRIADNYRQVVSYSKELEIKNQVLDAMWLEIKTSRDQLADLNKTLENRVMERTYQLAATNLELSSVNKELSSTNIELVSTMEILKKTQTQLIESEKLAALGQLIAGITHEINTPFGAIQASIGNISTSLNKILIDFLPFFQALSPEVQSEFLTLLRKALSNETEKLTSREERNLRKLVRKQLLEHQLGHSEEYADILATIGIDDIQPHLAILNHPENDLIIKMVYTVSGLRRNLKTIAIAAERTAKVVFALKSYTHHTDSDQMIQADIVQGIDTVLTLYQSKIKNNVNLVFNYQEISPIWCFPDELNQVWTNIIDNALYAMQYQGTLTIDVSTADAYVVICIIDSGPGIPAELTDKIFTPFFTTKPQGEGSGMGLDIVAKIIEKHHGHIKLDSIPGKTRFCFYIPLI